MPIGLNDMVEFDLHQDTQRARIYTYGSSTGMIACPGFTGIPRRRPFTKSGARHFWGVTCGMNEETRDHVVDQIDLSIADDIDPAAHGLVD